LTRRPEGASYYKVLVCARLGYWGSDHDRPQHAVCPTINGCITIGSIRTRACRYGPRGTAGS